MATFRTSHRDLTIEAAEPHVVLVGLPGSGKTTVGDLLARRLSRRFLDFDQEISRREGLSVAQIFGTRGEHYFREREHSLTTELRSKSGMILTPGGGWVGNPANIALLRPPSVLVYLKLKPATALKRMGATAAERPLLLRPNPVGEIEQMLAARKPAYESADLVVNTERLDPQGVMEKIIHLLDVLPPPNPNTNGAAG